MARLVLLVLYLVVMVVVDPFALKELNVVLVLSIDAYTGTKSVKGFLMPIK